MIFSMVSQPAPVSGEPNQNQVDLLLNYDPSGPLPPVETIVYASYFPTGWNFSLEPNSVWATSQRVYRVWIATGQTELVVTRHEYNSDVGAEVARITLGFTVASPGSNPISRTNALSAGLFITVGNNTVCRHFILAPTGTLTELTRDGGPWQPNSAGALVAGETAEGVLILGSYRPDTGVTYIGLFPAETWATAISVPTPTGSNSMRGGDVVGAFAWVAPIGAVVSYNTYNEGFGLIERTASGIVSHRFTNTGSPNIDLVHVDVGFFGTTPIDFMDANFFVTPTQRTVLPFFAALFLGGIPFIPVPPTPPFWTDFRQTVEILDPE